MVDSGNYDIPARGLKDRCSSSELRVRLVNQVGFEPTLTEIKSLPLKPTQLLVLELAECTGLEPAFSDRQSEAFPDGKHSKIWSVVMDSNHHCYPEGADLQSAATPPSLPTTDILKLHQPQYQEQDIHQYAQCTS
jgi:hypothetical protein